MSVHKKRKQAFAESGYMLLKKLFVFPIDWESHCCKLLATKWFYNWLEPVCKDKIRSAYIQKSLYDTNWSINSILFLPGFYPFAFYVLWKNWTRDIHFRKQPWMMRADISYSIQMVNPAYKNLNRGFWKSKILCNLSFFCKWRVYVAVKFTRHSKSSGFKNHPCRRT